jgi:hypothetical protein
VCGDAGKLEDGDLRDIDGNMLLYHGSRLCNMAGILSNGLKTSGHTALRTGAMFGNGVYLSEISSKAFSYCFAPTATPATLLICEARVGKALAFTAADHDAIDKAKAVGCNSVLGVGQTASTRREPLVGKPSISLAAGFEKGGDSKLLYPERIVPPNQVRVRYVIQVSKLMEEESPTTSPSVAPSPPSLPSLPPPVAAPLVVSSEPAKLSIAAFVGAIKHEIEIDGASKPACLYNAIYTHCGIPIGMFRLVSTDKTRQKILCMNDERSLSTILGEWRAVAVILIERR